MSDSPPVRIVVVSWNTREPLARCLTALGGDIEKGLAEVVVVDNASSDGSADLVAERHPEVRLLRAEGNLGFGPAVNRGAEGWRGPWLAVANADTAVEAGALQRLVDAGEADPRAGILAPRLVLPGGTTQHSVHRFPTLRLAALNGMGARHVGPLARRLLLEGSWAGETGGPVDWAHGAFLLVRREAFEAAGGFDPRQWMYAEDLDLSWRLGREGWTTRYVPEARVRHELSVAAIRAFGAERDRRWAAASYDWMERRLGRPRALAHALVAIAPAAVRAAALALPARVAPRTFAFRLARARRQAALHHIGLRRGAAGRASSPPPAGTLPDRDDAALR